jgi:hypothetical protein
MKSIQIDQDIFDFLVSRVIDPGESAATVLRRELQVPQSQIVLEIDDQTYAFITARASAIGESASDILRRVLHLSSAPPPVPPPSPAILVFPIPSGTGSLPWNTRETAASATVGDTLRIVNEDAIPHRLHTAGRPFPHPSTDILPGQTADFLLQTPFDPNVDGPLTDHDQGPQAQFWLRVGSQV